MLFRNLSIVGLTIASVAVAVVISQFTQPVTATGDGVALVQPAAIEPTTEVRPTIPPKPLASVETVTLRPIQPSADEPAHATEPTVQHVVVITPLESDAARDSNAVRELARDIQREMERAGCAPGLINGAWHAKTERAAKRFVVNRNAALPVSEPDAALLSLLQDYKGDNCGQHAAPLVRPGTNGVIQSSYAPSSRGTSGPTRPITVTPSAVRPAVPRASRTKRLVKRPQVRRRKSTRRVKKRRRPAAWRQRVFHSIGAD